MDPNAKSKSAFPVSHVLIGLAAVVVAGFIIYGLVDQSAVEGRRAPDLSMSLLNGGDVAVADLVGQPVVLNFWASWCDPCRQEAPTLAKVYRDYQDSGVAFLGVDVRDVAEKGQAFIREYGIGYPNASDPEGRAWRAYKLTGVPETLFISRDGIVLDRYLGEIPEDVLRASIDNLLAEAEASK